MKVANPKRIELMKDLITSIPDLNKERVLDVACGTGLLSQHEVFWDFQKVDMFDEKEDNINEIKKWSDSDPTIDKVDVAKMEKYIFEAKYSLIVMNWCTGYLDNEPLVEFLKKCKDALGSNKWPFGCLIVLDNIPNKDICSQDKEFGQRFRSPEENEELFKIAGLEIK